MNTLTKVSLAIDLLFSGSALAQTTLIHNLKGYTLEQGKLTQFSAIAFSGDKIEKIYQQPPNELQTQSTNVKVIDAKGQTMLPGLIDAHGHVLGWGLNLIRVDLKGSESEQAAVARVQAFRKQNRDLNWVQIGRAHV